MIPETDSQKDQEAKNQLLKEIGESEEQIRKTNISLYYGRALLVAAALTTGTIAFFPIAKLFSLKDINQHRDNIEVYKKMRENTGDCVALDIKVIGEVSGQLVEMPEKIETSYTNLISVQKQVLRDVEESGGTHKGKVWSLLTTVMSMLVLALIGLEQEKPLEKIGRPFYQKFHAPKGDQPKVG